MERSQFQLYFKNTAVITFLATVGTVLSSSVVAYGFARFQSRCSKLLFMVLLGTMMLPTQVTLIPSIYSTISWAWWTPYGR